MRYQQNSDKLFDLPILQLTDEIVRLETELNEAVYEAFELDAEERKLIEQETKYRYGEW